MGRWRSLTTKFFLGFLVATTSGNALAQPAATDRILAETLFREGRQLLADKKPVDACPKFAESQRLDPQIGTLLNLAVCHEQEGKLASAWAEYAEVATQATRARQPERSQFAREKSKALEPRLPRLRLIVRAPAPNLRVLINGRSLPSAAWGLAFPLDLGTYRIEAMAPGKTAWTTYFPVQQESASLTIMVPPLEEDGSGTVETPPAEATAPTAAEATPTPLPKKTEFPRKTAIIVAGSVALGGLTVGTIFGLRTLGHKRDGDAHCHGSLCDATGLDLQKQARTAATFSTVGFTVGLLGLGSAAYFFLHSAPTATASGRTSATVRLTSAAPSADRGGFAVEGTW